MKMQTISRRAGCHDDPVSPDRRERPHAARAIPALALVIAAMLAGCSSGPVHRRSAADAPPLSDQGRSWETVFAPSGHTLAERGSWESSRNEHRLSAQREDALSVASSWPERERARLDRPRRISLPRNADQIIYFQTESEYRSTYRGGYWGGYRGGWGDHGGGGSGGGSWWY